MIRLFTSGIHNGLDFSNADISTIHAHSIVGDNIPFVLGHPKNDLPILGWLPRGELKLYEEGSKMSIGFERGSAKFSEESIDALRKLKQNKISIRLKDGKISHAGLVVRAAVQENNQQDFAANKMNACFGAIGELPLDEEGGDKSSFFSEFKTALNEFKNNFIDHKTKNKMEDNAKDFSVQIEKLKNENTKLQTENEALKKASADFEAKVQSEKLAIGKKALEDKIKTLGYAEDKAKAATDFGVALLGKDDSLFQSWLAGLQAEKSPVHVLNGSVVTKDFSEENKETADASLRVQYASFKS